MAPNLTYIPSSIISGTTVKYTRSLSDYPAPTWTLKLHLAGKSAAHVTAVASGSDHVVTLTPAETAAISPGNYRWAEWVDDGTDTYEVANGVIQVTGDMSAATAGSLQSKAEKDLEVIEALLSGRLTKDQESYQIAGRAVTRIPISEIRKMRSDLRAEVFMQRNEGAFERPVRLTFPRTGSETQ